MGQMIELPTIVSAFRKHRLHVFLIVLSITVGVAIYSYFQPDIYSSAATIMNIEADKGFSGSSNMLQIFGLSKERNEGFLKFMAIIGSHTFKEKMVESLGPEFFTPEEGWKGTREELYNYGLGVLGSSIRLNIDPRQTNVLSVIVEMENNKLPPIIANQVLIVLQEYISENSLTKAKIVRKFVEDSIIETKAAIFETATSISNFYQNHPVNPEKSMIEYPLRKEILELSAKKYENDSRNLFLAGTLKSLNEKKEKLKQRLEEIKEIPEKSYFDYLEEEYQILKGINLDLRQQYEIAKLEDIKQEPAFQVLDKARVARKVGPRRKFMTLVGFVFSLLLATFYVLTKLFFQQTAEREKLQDEGQRLNVRVVA